MNNRVRRSYEMFLRVNDFMTANAADFSGVAFAAAAAAALQTASARIAALAAGKLQTTAAARDSTLARSRTRLELRAALEDIALVWKSAGPLPGDATYKFRLPRRPNDQNLVATAKTFALEAGLHRQFFLERGLPANFIGDLQTVTAAFEQAINRAESARRERIGAAAAFEAPLKQARDAVRSLDPLVRRFYRADPQKLAEWTTAARAVRHQSKPGKPQPAPQG